MVEYPVYQARVFAEEHALFDVDERCKLPLGDTVELVPGYAPTTVNLYDVYHVVEERRCGGYLADHPPRPGARRARQWPNPSGVPTSWRNSMDMVGATMMDQETGRCVLHEFDRLFQSRLQLGALGAGRRAGHAQLHHARARARRRGAGAVRGAPSRCPSRSTPSRGRTIPIPPCTT